MISGEEITANTTGVLTPCLAPSKHLTCLGFNSKTLHELVILTSTRKEKSRTREERKGKERQVFLPPPPLHPKDRRETERERPEAMTWRVGNVTKLTYDLIERRVTSE